MMIWRNSFEICLLKENNNMMIPNIFSSLIVSHVLVYTFSSTYNQEGTAVQAQISTLHPLISTTGLCVSLWVSTV